MVGIHLPVYIAQYTTLGTLLGIPPHPALPGTPTPLFSDSAGGSLGSEKEKPVGGREESLSETQRCESW